MALKDFMAQQEHLTQRLQHHFLDRIAGVSWLTLDAFDTNRLSKLISAVNESIARLEGAGLMLRSQVDRGGVGYHQDGRLHQAAKGQREVASENGSLEQPHMPRLQKGALRSSKRIADAVSNTLSQEFCGGQASRSASNVSKGSAQNAADVKGSSEISDSELLENLRSLWLDVLQPQLKRFVFNLPDDAEAVCNRRDVL